MKILNWILVLAGILGLISVRFLENKIFYDPFLEFFKADYKVAQVPDFIWGKLMFSHVFRFALNLIFSYLLPSKHNK